MSGNEHQVKSEWYYGVNRQQIFLPPNRNVSSNSGNTFFQGVNLNSISRLLINPICETAEKNLAMLQLNDFY